MIRVLTVDDHPLLREGIAALVNAEPDMKLIAEACNGQEAIEKFRAHRPDVTLMDLQMPEINGAEAIARIRDEFPDARIVVLTTYSGDVQVLKALKAGARAYILKGHFSTFANGWPGAGLALQRLAISMVLLGCGAAKLNTASHLSSAIPQVICVGAAIFLLVGLWTPMVGAVVACTELWIAFSGG